MNCPRCTAEMVVKGGAHACAKCGISVGGQAVSPVIEKVVEPEGSLKTVSDEPVQETVEKEVETADADIEKDE